MTMLDARNPPRPVGYHHRQWGWTILYILVPICVGLAALGQHPELGHLTWISLATLVVVTTLFGALTVTVDRTDLRVAMGVGLIRRRIALADIVGFGPVRNRWYWGFGIRLTPHGWLWNVSGLDAVELELADGRRFRVGTDEPERLCDALREAQRGL